MDDSAFNSTQAEAVRQLLWFVAGLARSRKTGALQALAADLAGKPPTDQWTRQQVKAAFAGLTSTR